MLRSSRVTAAAARVERAAERAHAPRRLRGRVACASRRVAVPVAYSARIARRHSCARACLGGRRQWRAVPARSERSLGEVTTGTAVPPMAMPTQPTRERYRRPPPHASDEL